MSASGLKLSTRTESEYRQSLDHRYCEDCKYFVGKRQPFFETDQCSFPREITGSQLVRRGVESPRVCATERSFEGSDSCGRAAKWFEPVGGAQ
jgi:hypothetical protein